MNAHDTLVRLGRRWYVAVPGFLLTAGLAAWMWLTVPPTYERTAHELLVPGEAALPASDASDPNPFLYLSGLDSATDVLVSAMNSDDVVREVTAPYPDSAVEVLRDENSAGPILIITVSAPSDADAGVIMQDMLGRTDRALDELQRSERVDVDARVTVSPIAVDSEGTPQQGDRLIATGAVAAAMLALTLLLTAAVDGLVRRPRHRDTEPDDGDEPAGTGSGPGRGSGRAGLDPGDDFHVDIVRLLDGAAPNESVARSRR